VYLWDQPGIPQRGWEHIEVYDLEAPIHTCEMCGKESVRYVHRLQHSECARVLDVGCVCAGKMCEDYELARERERSVRNRVARAQAAARLPVVDEQWTAFASSCTRECARVWVEHVKVRVGQVIAVRARSGRLWRLRVAEIEKRKPSRGYTLVACSWAEG
jgi:hypothetical protein